MFSHLVRTLIVLAVGSSFLVGAVSCTQAAARKSKKRSDSGELFEDDYAYEEEEDPETPITITTKDAGTISVPARPSDGGGDARTPEAGKTTPCTTPIGPGDLRIVEFMISSKKNAGDNGEWVEIQNYRDCTVDVNGITISSPRGTSGIDSVTVNQSLVLASYGTFVVAGSADPSQNGGLPQPVIGWGATDVLKNDGDTIEITTSAGTVIDKITYPYVANRVPGESMAFPYDCGWIDRFDPQDPIAMNASKWSRAVTVYNGAPTLEYPLKGTPNMDNWDVTCLLSP